jgi:hypothetical protein
MVHVKHMHKLEAAGAVRLCTTSAAANDPAGGVEAEAAFVYAGPGAGTRSVLSALHSLKDALRPSIKARTQG